MKKSTLSDKDKKEKKAGSRIAFQGGSYSLAVTAIVLAVLVVLNILVSALPTTVTKYDISSSKLYSITSNTKAVVNALDKDVTIYWIVQAGEEDDIIENLLGKYESTSGHIDVVKKNPDIYPTFAEKYTTDSVLNNSLVVECGDRSRYISYSDIYVSEINMSTYSYETSFDGEGAITSAIDYVVNEEQPKIYVLEGHGEEELPDSFSEQIEKENMETDSLSLINTDAIPDDADCILIYAPESDISSEEKDMLADYAKAGGKMLVFAGPTEDGTPENLYSLLNDYGVEAAEGIVVDVDREHYAFQAPYILLPDMESSEITDPLIEKKYHAIIPLAQGMTVADSEAGTVTKLLTTSDLSYSKTDGYNLTTYEKEDDDIDGPFALAVSVDCGNDGQIIWFSSSYFLEDTYNSYSAGANLDLGMNALSSMLGESKAVAIRSKSLSYNYLTISDSTASVLKTMMIGVFPVVYLGIGIGVILKRRKQNEAV
ncbi:MAG: GldG family protein [Butyrivibrio sp.]